MDDYSIIHSGWLEMMSESSISAWEKLSGKKPWKKRFIVLKQAAVNPDEIQLAAYDKDDQWRIAPPKKSMMLFPRYKIAKLCNFKGKEKNCLVVENDNEQWHLTSEKLKNLDLWATQIQMQTKLSRSISGRIFSVSGAVQKDMQRIGAAQQRCLLHFTKWGITLALQDSRSILAMWPLRTIRNYEDSAHCEFTIESGRRAPMGEGNYKFYTNLGQDRDMFNVIDAFVNALLNEQAYTSGKKQTTDEEILQSFEQLHRSATACNAESRPKIFNNVDTPGYSHIGEMKKVSRDSGSVSIYKPPDYHHLYGADVDYTRVEVEKKHSPSDKDVESPRDGGGNYDKLGEYNHSWSTASPLGEYDHIHHRGNHTPEDSVYDKIDRSEHGQSFKARSQGASWGGMVGYPLREEPSVPFLDEASGSDKKFSSSATLEGEKFVFRNSIYSPLGSSIGSTNDGQPSRRLTSPSQDFNAGIGSIRHGSTASEGGTRRKQNGTSIRDKSHQDIADHFMYQVPSLSLSSRNGFGHTREGSPIRGALVDATLTGDLYHNHDPLVDGASFVDSEMEKENLDHPMTDDEDTEIYENSERVASSFENKEVYQDMKSARATAASAT